MSDDPNGRSPDADESSGRGFLGRLFDAVRGEVESEAQVAATATEGLGVAALRRLRIDDIAIPKIEIVAVPDTIPLPDLIALFREHGFSRVPVYRGTLDHPLGLVHLKDLALKHGFGGDAGFDLAPMLRPLLYVPPSMALGVALQQMQRERIHMALVIDEYGGVDGLVTLEDLIEQVIGQIDDEHDELEGHLWVREGDGRWLVQGRAPLDAVAAETGLGLVLPELEDEIDTIGGLVVMLEGGVPAQGSIVPHPAGPRLEVVEADGRRVKRVRVISA